jgi:hypothetical protein
MSSKIFDDQIRLEEQNREAIILEMEKFKFTIRADGDRGEIGANPLSRMVALRLHHAGALAQELERQKKAVDERLSKLYAAKQDEKQKLLITEPNPSRQLIPSADFRDWTYGNETFRLNGTEAQRAMLLWDARSRGGVRRQALIDGTGYEKPSKLFQSRDGERFYKRFIRNRSGLYWIEIPKGEPKAK